MNENDKDFILEKVKRQNENIWEGKITEPKIKEWLNNFEGQKYDIEIEKSHALYLLSQFMYFGLREIKELIKSLYRDNFKYNIVSYIRKSSNDITDRNILNAKYKSELSCSQFLGIGNPSESGTHLLYYFRQENKLPRTNFINAHEIFKRSIVNGNIIRDIKNNKIKRYVFIDDFCGSGEQGVKYSRDIVEEIKAKDNNIEIYYLQRSR
ncbi:MAG: hypothetical protein U5L00_05165 [Desulfovermiculus sp.]|nr:hypothetical protein [Desulfovermiculus sp.]